MDAPGNWSTFVGDTATQSRTHNAQNQVTNINGQATLAYDHDGNLTTEENGRSLTYDAWGRLVGFSSGGLTLAGYGYDALGRRIQETTGQTTRDVYFSAGWQDLEERVNAQVQDQYVWSPVAPDTLVERDRDPNGSGTLSERLYAQQDANGDVTAVVSSSGQVVESYIYEPYGEPPARTPEWQGGTHSLPPRRGSSPGGLRKESRCPSRTCSSRPVVLPERASRTSAAGPRE